VPTPTSPRLITRRDFLGGLGLVIGGISIAGIVHVLDSTGQRQPLATGSVDANATPSPNGAGAARSPSPSPDLTALRHQYHSRPDLSPPVMQVDVPASKDVADGLLFLTPNDGDGVDGPMIADDAGEPVWMLPVPGQRATDLQVVDFRGQPALLWWEGLINGGIGSGEVVVVDGTYREIARLQVGNGYRVDLHECRFTPQGTVLMTGDAGVSASRVSGVGSYTGQVLDCGVWEIDLATGKTLFEWHGVDHIAADETYVDAPKDASAIWDYLHVNSIDPDTDGGFLLSARNTSAVYRIDRATGAIRWRLGGRRSDFTIGQGADFSWQHDARRHPDGSISIFDDSTDPHTSRGIIISVDESTMRSTLIKAYARKPPVLAHSQGNVQVLPNGNVLVGWGDAPYFTEFASDGRILFDVGFPAAKMSYRVFRSPWIGRPTEPPAIAVLADSSGMTAYASWNGATEVAAWEALAGPTAGTLAPVARTSRSGFETAIRLPTPQPMVAVRALDASGARLGESAPVTIGS
jgi:hypothetical protein